MKQKLAYLSYPYSDDPKRRCKEINEIAGKIIKNHPEIVLIVPHFAVDILATSQIGGNRLWIADWELELISRCDYFILGCTLDYKLSPGMVWEHAFAKRLGIKVIKVHDLLGTRSKSQKTLNGYL